MNVEKSEINGFLIDEFNQYGLSEGKTQGTCPLCSSDRKQENKKPTALLMIGSEG